MAMTEHDGEAVKADTDTERNNSTRAAPVQTNAEDQAAISWPRVHINLLEDLRNWLISQMLTASLNIPANPDVDSACLYYFTWMQRRIPQRMRTVSWSAELQGKKDRRIPDTRPLDGIQAEVVAGEDLNPRLHRAIKSPAERSKHDMLLYDWGIHHLHTGPRRPGAEFVARSGPVLFVYATPDIMYFIDILPHGTGVPKPWAKESLLRIIFNNWPNLLIKTPIVGGRPIAETDRIDAREHGIQTLWKGPDGVNYYPLGGGYSMAKVSTNAVSDTHRLKDRVRQMESFVRENARTIAENIGQAAGLRIDDLRCALRFQPSPTGEGFMLVVEELTTKLTVDIAR